MSERRYNIRQVLAHPSVFDVKTAWKIKGSVGSEPLDTFNTQGKEVVEPTYNLKDEIEPLKDGCHSSLFVLMYSFGVIENPFLRILCNFYSVVEILFKGIVIVKSAPV